MQLVPLRAHPQKWYLNVRLDAERGAITFGGIWSYHGDVKKQKTTPKLLTSSPGATLVVKGTRQPLNPKSAARWLGTTDLFDRFIHSTVSSSSRSRCGFLWRPRRLLASELRVQTNGRALAGPPTFLLVSSFIFLVIHETNKMSQDLTVSASHLRLLLFVINFDTDRKFVTSVSKKRGNRGEHLQTAAHRKTSSTKTSKPLQAFKEDKQNGIVSGSDGMCGLRDHGAHWGHRLLHSSSLESVSLHRKQHCDGAGSSVETLSKVETT
ncbi:hypothetical protein CCH79_00008087 [Gambusia affinis]|uniref:Uncharacterized protein n=1 Tax=Gambusia affinis TaxID=33528 RepID=A0A315V5H9_GAMAF|nr:hypothetical protein CCH79_00008087 [Gambusia affinis]